MPEKFSAQINLRQTSKGLETVLKHIEHNLLLLKLWELGDQFPRQLLALFAVVSCYMRTLIE